jgi:hypothetical protein
MMKTPTRQVEAHKSKIEREEPCALNMLVTSALPSSVVYLSLEVEDCGEIWD